MLVPVLGGDSSSSPLPKGELLSQVEHTHSSTARQPLRLTPLRNQAKNIRHGTTCGSSNVIYYSRSIRWRRDRCCGHLQHWQTVHQCYEFIYLLQICYQLCSWLNGSGKEVHSQKELQSPIPQKLQSQRKYPIFMWFKKVAGREVETLEQDQLDSEEGRCATDSRLFGVKKP